MVGDQVIWWYSESLISPSLAKLQRGPHQCCTIWCIHLSGHTSPFVKRSFAGRKAQIPGIPWASLLMQFPLRACRVHGATADHRRRQTMFLSNGLPPAQRLFKVAQGACCHLACACFSNSCLMHSTSKSSSKGKQTLHVAL